MNNYLKKILIFSYILLISCERELDINDFSDDFSDYTNELRIEALILPSNNTAIVRIDRTIPLNETEIYNCIDDDGDWDITTDDLGEDGVAADPNNGIEEDLGEGNGVPDCGEPHVDEYSEILPQIHVSDCTVSISVNNNSCNLIYKSDGGSFYLDTDLYENDISGVDVVNYGAYVPDDNCKSNNFEFNLYDTEYSFKCTCQGEYEKYGEIIAFDTISKPVIFFHPDSISNVIDCANENYTIENDIYQCLSDQHVSDTLYVDMYDYETMIHYASLFDNRFYYAEQSFYDETNNRYIYYHGHPAGGTEESGYLINNKISWFTEQVVAEPYFGIIKFKYDIYTFSEGYKNYYFWSQLSLNDPERTNLRDSNGLPVMGGFGGMTSRTKYFKLTTN